MMTKLQCVTFIIVCNIFHEHIVLLPPPSPLVSRMPRCHRAGTCSAFSLFFCGRELIMRYGLWIKGLQRQKKKGKKETKKAHEVKRMASATNISYVQGHERLRELLSDTLFLSSIQWTLFSRARARAHPIKILCISIYIFYARRRTVLASTGCRARHSMIRSSFSPSCDDHSVQRSFFVCYILSIAMDKYTTASGSSLIIFLDFVLFFFFFLAFSFSSHLAPAFSRVSYCVCSFSALRIIIQNELLHFYDVRYALHLNHITNN